MKRGVRLQPGEWVSIKGEPHQIISVVSLNKVKVAHLSHGAERIVAPSVLKPYTEAKSSVYKDWDHLTPKQKEKANERYEVIKPLLKHTGKGFTEAVKQRAAECRVSDRTLKRWLADYRKRSQRSTLAGKTTPGGVRKNRLSPDVETIIQTVIADFYETPERPTIRQAYEEVCRLCRQSRLEPPRYDTVRRRINNRNRYAVTKRRRGKQAAEDAYGLVEGEPLHADHPLSLVQMDNQLMDIMLVDEEDRQPIGRPWLTAAIDRHSRMVTGFYVGLDAPNATSVGLCLLQMIAPKDALLREAGLDSGLWPVWGFPARLQIDGGKDFNSRQIESFCHEHSIELDICPVRSPSMKGAIERFFRTLNERKVHALPGSTRSNPRDRGQYDSEGRAIFTLRELEQELLEFIVCDYNNKPHRGIDGMTPADKWRIGIEGDGKTAGIGLPAIPSDIERLRLQLLPYEERTLQRYGIQWDNLFYVSETIRALRNMGIKRARVRRNPRDVSKIWLENPKTGQFEAIPCRKRGMGRRSLWELRSALKSLKEKGLPRNEATIHEALTHERIEHARHDTKKARRARQRRKEDERMVSKAKGKPATPPRDGEQESNRARGNVVSIETGKQSSAALPKIDFSKIKTPRISPMGKDRWKVDD